jgi:hypothetical protein
MFVILIAIQLANYRARKGALLLNGPRREIGRRGRLGEDRGGDNKKQ